MSRKNDKNNTIITSFMVASNSTRDIYSGPVFITLYLFNQFYISNMIDLKSVIQKCVRATIPIAEFPLYLINGLINVIIKLYVCWTWYKIVIVFLFSFSLWTSLLLSRRLVQKRTGQKRQDSQEEWIGWYTRTVNMSVLLFIMDGNRCLCFSLGCRCCHRHRSFRSNAIYVNAKI